MRVLVAIGDSGGMQVEFGLGAERFIGWQDERLEPVALGGCIADGMAKKWQLVCQGRPKNRHLGWGVVGLEGEHDAGESLEGCGECWQKSGRRLTSV